ncbi:MAG: hypothetical protein KIT22_06700 [Verrucomicrobiae bacterium]|nr:hypothetical protein [Verrucomicrobiae bacterium]
MKAEMRQKLAREPYPEKIRKVAQLIQLAKTFPRRPRLIPRILTANEEQQNEAVLKTTGGFVQVLESPF